MPVHKSISLQLLTNQSVYDAHAIRLLSRWRKKHEAWFPTQFPVTHARTALWLQQRVQDEPDRLLFFVEAGGVLRGHVGLYRFDFDTKRCEIDNIVRGRSGYKGMMEKAVVALMRWGTDILGIEDYTLQTTSDNVRALSLYKKIGFFETNREPHNNRYTVCMKWRKNEAK